METSDLGKTSTGIQANVAGLLCYLVGIVTGIVFLLIEKENKFVRFHAMQSTMTFGGLFVINIVLNFVPIIGAMVGMLLALLGLAVWIVLMVKSYQGEMFKLPVIGDMAEQAIAK